MFAVTSLNDRGLVIFLGDRYDAEGAVRLPEAQVRREVSAHLPRCDSRPVCPEGLIKCPSFFGGGVGVFSGYPSRG